MSAICCAMIGSDSPGMTVRSGRRRGGRSLHRGFAWKLISSDVVWITERGPCMDPNMLMLKVGQGLVGDVDV